jgi:hypothetical protein
VPPKVTVDAKLGTVLLFKSCAVMVVMLKAVPAVCGEEMAEIAKWFSAPGLMVAIVAEPVWPEPSFTVTVRFVPATVAVTLAPLSTPEVNAPEVPLVPEVPPKVTVDAKLGTVLLFKSWAVMVAIVKAVPAVCGEEIAEIAKW